MPDHLHTDTQHSSHCLYGVSLSLSLCSESLGGSLLIFPIHRYAAFNLGLV